MAIYRVDDIRDLSIDEIENNIEDLKSELSKERSLLATGSAPENPGRIRELRRTIARLKTIKAEKEKQNE
ncbi:MAG TPA: 50S ribosomal protein L29 [Methanofastidiosum sp.]|jgi:large subunit ribosomal protein L29|nr:50S ribosomal protein L29 [Methanofastidiosum sp.]HNZ87511.1 50S ribosomal protein L29 [Methanofastidiosum sp.]HOC78223.1 50S ribosomal protein L29 [Methanofastidiosum sp.]HPA49827.1 50S ribosomal protein L29 [Methanofastidiosum sp.]HQK63208.1 50S ribosomal protein L29 [Methanofastidiosum sp.]